MMLPEVCRQINFYMTERKEGGIVSGVIDAEKVERNEVKAVRFFDSANSFADILNLISQAPAGTLLDSGGREVDVRHIFTIQREAQQGLVPAESIEKITRQGGLREAVVRALAPDFSRIKGPNASETLFFILHFLQFLKSQEDVFVDGGVYGENKTPLKILFDSSNRAIDINTYIQKVEGIIEALKSDHTINLTGNSPFLAMSNRNGLKTALLEAISTITGDTGPISMETE